MVQPSDNETSVYRTEALQHRRDAWLGTAALPQHAKGLSLTCITIVAMLSLICSLAFGQYSERVSASGTVVLSPPAVVMFSPSEGTVVAVHAVEGQAVQKGTPLFAISAATHIQKGSFTQESRKLLETRRAALLDESRQVRSRMDHAHSLINEKVESNKRAQQRQQALIQRASEQARWLKDRLTKYERLRRAGTVLELELSERTKDLFLADETVSAAEVRALDIEREYLNFREQALVIEKEAQSRLDALSNQIFLLDQHLLDVEKAEEFLVLAPANGTLVSVTAHTGARVQPTSSLGVVIPDGAVPKIEAYAPSDAIGKLDSGQSARIRVAAFPYRQYGKFVGTVESVSQTPINLHVSPYGERGKPLLYRITLKLDTPQDRLKNLALASGMEAHSDIFVRTAPLYQWVFKTVSHTLS